MRKYVHQAAGLAVGTTAFLAGSPLEFACGVFIGSTAPDWLEIPWWINGQRYSLIPHRTLTHWLLLWFAALSTLTLLKTMPLTILATGFLVGGIVHICLDAVTPMGVPLIIPRRRRAHDVAAATIITGITAAAVYPLLIAH